MKEAAELLTEVLRGRAWCTTCGLFVAEKFVKDSYGHPYHTGCGEDVYYSHILDQHEVMIKRALEVILGTLKNQSSPLKPNFLITQMVAPPPQPEPEQLNSLLGLEDAV